MTRLRGAAVGVGAGVGVCEGAAVTSGVGVLGDWQAARERLNEARKIQRRIAFLGGMIAPYKNLTLGNYTNAKGFIGKSHSSCKNYHGKGL
jgi:hypothetical protein